MSKKELYFNIEDGNPHTIPMERLAEYLKELAILLGSQEAVHFLRVDEGSVACAMEVDEEEEANIVGRVEGAREGRGTKEAIKAYDSLRSSLKRDNNSAYLEWKGGDVILEFRKEAPGEQETFGPFWQEGTLDGILVKLGGLDDTVPVHLIYEGAHHICNTTREVAKELGHHLYGRPIRVSGKGKWYRNSEGKWELRWFDIYRFEELSDASLPDVVARLRAIPDNALMSSKDPLGDIQRIRHGED